jgi:uncharacterized protein YecT (DUF1311 family)
VILAMMLVSWPASGAQQLPGAVPPPPEQFLADCESPTYASDVVVCADDGLMSLDRRLGTLYEPLRTALEPGGNDSVLDPHALIETQVEWFRRRSLCAFRERQADCLQAAYEERLQVLEAIEAHLRDPSPEALLAVCRDAPWGLAPTRIVATQLGQLILTDEAARLRAVAVGESPRDGWTPFLRHEAEGSQLRLFPLEGPVMTCELRQPH